VWTAHIPSRDAGRLAAGWRLASSQWRADLMAGASLKTTNIHREYPASVYRHYQWGPKGGSNPFAALGAAGASKLDDYHTPTQPTRYIALRIKPMLKFYAQRIPAYTRNAMTLRLMILMFGVAASILARYDELTLVVAVTAAATVTTSWAEFSDSTRKVERYSTAAGALKALLDWWDSLGEVQKASKDSIADLVDQAEAIIAEEQFAWTSTSSKHEIEKQGDNQEKKYEDTAIAAVHV
jgi:hypothetical protein